MPNSEPGIWVGIFGCFSILISTLGAILVELIRNRRKTEDVRQEVVNTKDSADTQLLLLADDVRDIKLGLNDHIRWHLERDRGHVYVSQRR